MLDRREQTQSQETNQEKAITPESGLNDDDLPF